MEAMREWATMLTCWERAPCLLLRLCSLALALLFLNCWDLSRFRPFFSMAHSALVEALLSCSLPSQYESSKCGRYHWEGCSRLLGQIQGLGGKQKSLSLATQTTKHRASLVKTYSCSTHSLYVYMGLGGFATELPLNAEQRILDSGEVIRNPCIAKRSTKYLGKTAPKT